MPVSQPRLLLIDTATERALLASSHGQEIRDCRRSDQPRDHAALLLTWLDTLLPAAQAADSLDAIAFNAGPGSFTGLRVGCSLAQALAFAWQKPVLMLSSLQLLADTLQREQPLQEGEAVLVVIDARMQEVYWQYFLQQDGVLQAQGEATVSAPEHCLPPADTVCRHAIGSGAALLPDASLTAWGIEHRADIQPQAEDLLAQAHRLWQAGAAVSAEQAAPHYVRQRVALTTAEREQRAAGAV